MLTELERVRLRSRPNILQLYSCLAMHCVEPKPSQARQKYTSRPAHIAAQHHVFTSRSPASAETAAPLASQSQCLHSGHKHTQALKPNIAA